MNEITAAIKKKAEEKYESLCNEAEKIGNFLFPMKSDVLEAYTCGGEDAIGFMLKFVEWVQVSGYEYLFADEIWMNIKEEAWNKYTTEFLLIKYMEDNKL